jgi:hypothetical protein
MSIGIMILAVVGRLYAFCLSKALRTSATSAVIAVRDLEGTKDTQRWTILDTQQKPSAFHVTNYCMTIMVASETLLKRCCRRERNEMQICPRCKGEGKVFDKCTLLLTVGLPIAFLIQGQNKELTHEECTKCGGSGFLGGGTGGNRYRSKSERNQSYAGVH